MYKPSKKHVQFNLIPTVITEPDGLCELLHKARVSNHLQQKADKLRLERLLVPILTTEHRTKIKHRNNL
jgi:hypothetical protein